MVWMWLTLACDPTGSASPERQANGRAGDGDIAEGPVEQVITDALEREDAERIAAEQARDARRLAERTELTSDREHDLDAAAAWDLRFIDLLGAHLTETYALGEAVAARGDTAALRALGAESARQAARWRRELAVLRGAHYGDTTFPDLPSAPDLDALGPVTRRLAEGPAADEPPVVPLGGARDTGIGDTPFAEVAAARRARLGDDAPISLATAVDVMGSMHARGALVATAGTMQASRAELRALALHVQLAEERSGALLRALAARVRG